MNQYVKFVKVTEEDLLYNAQELKWNGSGIKEDLFLIESPEMMPENFQIYNSSLYISFKSCKLNKVRFKNCQNISVEDCKLFGLYIVKSSGIEVKNTHFNEALSLTDCRNINFEYCAIPWLDIASSFENSFRHCSINEIISSFCRGNIFEHNEIPELSLEMLKANTFGKLQTSLIFILSGIFVLILHQFIRLLNENANFWLIFGAGIGLIFLLYGIIMTIFTIYSNTKKMKQYPPNKII